MLFLIRILGILLTFRINPSVLHCSKFHAESEYRHGFVVNSIGYFNLFNQRCTFLKNVVCFYVVCILCFYVGMRPARGSFAATIHTPPVAAPHDGGQIIVHVSKVHQARRFLHLQWTQGVLGMALPHRRDLPMLGRHQNHCYHLRMSAGCNCR